MFAELLAHPDVVERTELRSRVGFLALHGGLEEATAEIGALCAEAVGASFYAVVQPPDLAWHVPSHQFDAESSPALRQVLDHCDALISLHGYGRHGFWTSVLVGGADRELARVVAHELRVALPGYQIIDDLDAIPRDLRGLDARNPVNAGRGGGVQLELPPRVRGMGPHWRDFDGDGLTPHAEALVDALARVASSLDS